MNEENTTRTPRRERPRGTGIALSPAAALLAAGLLLLPGSGLPAAHARQTPTPPSAAAGETADPADLKVRELEVSPGFVRVGDVVRISMLLHNTGTSTARSQTPSPETVYTPADSYEGRGFGPPPAGSYSVVGTVSGPKTGDRWPWRWGIGGNLAAGDARRVSYPIRFDRPGKYTVYVGTAVGDRVKPSTGAYMTSVQVVARGAALPANRNLRYTPPPVRVTVNGRVVDADKTPRFFEPRMPTSNVHMLVPIRFVMEELGADVRWDRETRTAAIRGADPSRTMTLRAGSRTHTVAGKRARTSVALPVRDGRMMVPLWFVTENLGGDFAWDVRTRTLAITVPERAGAAGNL